jgi:hypothetical protein
LRLRDRARSEGQTQGGGLRTNRDERNGREAAEATWIWDFPRATGKNGDRCCFWLLLAAQLDKIEKSKQIGRELRACGSRR